MASVGATRRARRSIDDGFIFVGDAVATENREELRAALFEVEDRDAVGAGRTFELWRKTATQADADLRELWLHEMPQVQLLISCSRAREVVVDLLELVEGDHDFGIVLGGMELLLLEMIRRGLRQHWLKKVSAPRHRMLLWWNVRRLAVALGIVDGRSAEQTRRCSCNQPLASFRR